MNVPQITHGSKMGIHSIRPHRVMGLVRAAAERGITWAVVKSVDNAGVLIDTRRLSPKTITMFRRVSPDFDSAQGIEHWTPAAMQDNALAAVAFCADNLNAEERAAIDYYEPVNEADPPGVEGWRKFGRYLREIALEGTRRGIRLVLPATNYGTPEWDEMVALVETGVFQALKAGGHLWSAHEGANPHGNDPMSFGPIPGAPSVPDAGPGFWRYRYLYHLLASRDEVVPLVISEFYAGLGYDDIDTALARFWQYDRELRREPYVVAWLPFTVDPTDDWRHQDYTPHFEHPAMLDYLASQKDVPNATMPDLTPPAPEPPWWQAWPEGTVYNPPLKLAATGQTVKFYNADGTPHPWAPRVARDQWDVFERAGVLLRVTNNVNPPLWVRVEDVQPG